MRRNLGDMAEAELRKWAGQVNITANPSESDREGWDFILQFPEILTNDKPLDLSPSRIECFVQVKGVGNKKNRLSISLSNWRKLVKTPLPAFFLIIDYGFYENPQNAFLIHIGENLISKVMKRLRSISLTKTSSLNKMTLDLIWGEDNKLKSLNGDGLQEAICSYVGDDFSSYILEKKRLCQEVGVDAPFIVTFTTEPYKSYEELMTQMVDFAIGLQDNIHMSKMLIEENVRFGIPAKRIEEGEGYLSILNRSQTGKPLKVVFSNQNESLQSVFNGDLRTPDYLFPNNSLSPEFQKMRIETEVGDIILGRHLSKFTINFRVDMKSKPRKLSDLVNEWRLAKILDQSKTEGCFIEIFDNFNPHIRFEFRNVGSLSKAHLLISNAIEDAWFIARQFDIPQDCEISLEEVYRNRQVMSEIRLLLELNNIGIGFDLDGELELSPNEDYAVVMGRQVKFGSKFLFLVIGFVGRISNLHIDKGMYFIKFPGRISLKHCYSQETNENQIEFLINKTETELVEKGFNVIPNHIESE